jgi:hypothetical protein
VRSLSVKLGCVLHLDALEIGIVESELDSGLVFVPAEDSANLLVVSAVSDNNVKLPHEFLLLILRKVDADEKAEMKEEPSLSESSPRSMMSMIDGEMVCASSPSS